MLCTFTLGFAVTFLSMYSYEDLIAMDTRFANEWNSLDAQKITGFDYGDKASTLLPSTSMNVRGYYAISFLSVSTVM
eukprot:9202569-Pyramimonas_sp.AAC.1